jgi:protein tyrosine phosphatase (PTP) superfamily phosphohydrolase (DUF442 family)
MVRTFLIILASACALTGYQRPSEPTRVSTQAVGATLLDTAYDRAMRVRLSGRSGENGHGLLNVHRLSSQIISGSEPEDETGFARMAALGVKTILSVDGKAPDVETAKRYGMRYVHVPIQYRGITEDELLRIAKTFHELQGPFFVHCFHGRHRGPAAAAVGRVLIDGVSRDQALAEMRQWCGTSGKYEGLYEVVASRALPTRRVSASLAWDFPSQVRFDGLRSAMIESTRIYDHLRMLGERGWKVDPEHPDLDPAHEAGRLVELLDRATLDACGAGPAGLRQGMTDVADQVRALEGLLEKAKGGDAEAALDASEELRRIKQSCNACHRVFRN